ncbi:uncharacterized protein V1477_020189 [Vespula maculifrons]|uniref:Secreted protein n=1 Tax=Vespula maculifrons TaxID=7453 RepID=A0ABD2AL85_VESMC
MTLTVTSLVVLWYSARTQMRSGDTRFRGTTTMSGLWPTFIVPSSVVLWTSTRELRKISCIPFLQLLTNS